MVRRPFIRQASPVSLRDVLAAGLAGIMVRRMPNNLPPQPARPCPFLSAKPDVRQPSCDQCGKDVDATVAVGEPLHWDTATAKICKPCMLEALELFP